MRSLRIVAFISSFLSAPAIFAQATNQDWRFAHPGATLIGGFRVKATLDSPLVNQLITQATAKDPSTGNIVAMVRAALGGVSEVRFSVRDAGKGKNPDVLALVTGVLDDATVGLLTQSKAGVRRIDAHTLLVGEGQSLADAIVRLNKPATGLQARSIERSKALAKNDLWIAGSLPELPMTIPVLDSLRGVALGISAQSDLRIEVALETANAKTAEDLVSSARRSQAQQPGLGAALQSEVDGSTARFRFVMEGNQVIETVQQAMAGKGAQSPLAALLGPSLMPGEAVASDPVFRESAPEPKPKRDTIRILGLEDGPREIKPEPRQ